MTVLNDRTRLTDLLADIKEPSDEPMVLFCLEMIDHKVHEHLSYFGAACISLRIQGQSSVSIALSVQYSGAYRPRFGLNGPVAGFGMVMEVAKFMIGRGHKPKPGPMLLLRQEGKGAEFACAFDVVKNGATPRIKSVRSVPFTPAHPLSAVWEIKADTGTYYVNCITGAVTQP